MTLRNRISPSRALIIALALCLTVPPALCSSVALAAVGEYEVQICSPEGNALNHGLTFDEGEGSTDFEVHECSLIGGVPTIALEATSGTVSGFAEWNVVAAPGTSIHSVVGERRVILTGGP